MASSRFADLRRRVRAADEDGDPIQMAADRAVDRAMKSHLLATEADPQDSDDEDDDDMTDTTKKPAKPAADDKGGIPVASEQAIADARAEGEAAARSAANERVKAVFASEHSQGRERLAAKMLGTSMSAEEIVGLLEESPKADAGEKGNQMLETLAGNPNPDIAPGNEGKPDTRASADAIWDKARPNARSN